MSDGLAAIDTSKELTADLEHPQDYVLRVLWKDMVRIERDEAS